MCTGKGNDNCNCNRNCHCHCLTQITPIAQIAPKASTAAVPPCPICEFLGTTFYEAVVVKLPSLGHERYLGRGRAVAPFVRNVSAARSTRTAAVSLADCHVRRSGTASTTFYPCPARAGAPAPTCVPRVLARYARAPFSGSGGAPAPHPVVCPRALTSQHGHGPVPVPRLTIPP